MEELKQIEIKKCSSPIYWYANRVRNGLKYLALNETEEHYIVRIEGGSHRQYGAIDKTDAKFIDYVQNNVQDDKKEIHSNISSFKERRQIPSDNKKMSLVLESLTGE